LTSPGIDRGGVHRRPHVFRRKSENAKPDRGTGIDPSYKDLGARVEHILRLAEQQAEDIREDARREAGLQRAQADQATASVPADAERFYVLLATRDGRIGLVSDRIYTDHQQIRDLAAEQATTERSPEIRYSIGVIRPGPRQSR
jgi:hypothetical protein